MESTFAKIDHPFSTNQDNFRNNNRVNQTDSLTDETAGQSLESSIITFKLYGILHDHHETQVSECEEADLHKYVVGCTKNQGHEQFKHVTKFRMEDLPEGYHDIDLYELIKATAYLTVRVSVKKTSPHRPEFHPGTRFSYPFFDIKNKNTLRLGTGEIFVRKYIDGHRVDGEKKYLSLFDESTRTCPCTKCQHSDKPNNVWWQINVNTATHVVFDEFEARHTTCRLFYDEQDSPEVSLDGFSIALVNIVTDRCILRTVTCDSLGEELYIMQNHRINLWVKVSNKYTKNYDDEDKSDLTFIVSHPHGCFKQISVGQRIDNYYIFEQNEELDNTMMTYTTPTCPGSSGSRVHCMRKANVHVHSGFLDSELNYSNVGLYMK